MFLLIPLALALITFNFYLAFYQNSTQSFRRSTLAAAIFTFLFIAASTEFLTIFSLITPLAVGITWALFNAALFLWLQKQLRSNTITIRQVVQNWYLSARSFLKQLGPLVQIVLFSLLLFTFLVALIATPNNLDSLTYHLSRLGYWIQNRSVGHYASHIQRAISFSPFSEYVHLHTYLLAGSGRFFQLSQWSCFVGILAFVSLLVEIFSKSLPAIRLALCYTASLPIVLLESMTTQNDLVVGFFIIAAVFYIFDFVRVQSRVSLVMLVPIAALGVMTKGTFLFYTFPFCLYLFIQMIRGNQLKLLSRLFIGVILCTLLINAPFWNRTYQVFGSPIGNVSSGNQTSSYAPKELVSSLSKHVFLHLGFVSPGNRYNDFLLDKLTGFHNWMGVPLNGPDDTMDFKMNKLNFNEDFAQNFLGMWLFIIALLIAPFARLTAPARWYFILSVASFLLFCALINYQTFGSRLHLPFFLMIAPAIGLIYGHFSGFLNKSLIIILWINALPFTLLSVTHPLLSTRWFFEQVFPVINESLHLNIHVENLLNLKQESIISATPEKMIWGDKLPEVNRLAQYVDSLHAQNIGFDFLESSMDYGFQYVLRKPGRHFEHVRVRNESRVLEKTGFDPDCIIAEYNEGNSFDYHGKTYYRTWAGVRRWIYVPKKQQF